MKGLFVIQKERLAILDLPDPVPGPYEALVQVEACAICNSTDWKIVHGEFVSGTFPILLGHESVGRVIQIGGKVCSFQPGDRVLRTTLRDEHIPFPGGRSCWGGFVEKAIVTDVWSEKEVPYNSFPHPQQIVPQGISSTQATMLITLKETLSCLENTDIKAGGSLAIIGTGPVAQALTYFAKLLGIHPLAVYGRNPALSDVFLSKGADFYITREIFPEAVNNIRQEGGFDRVIEAAGSRSALSLALQIVKPDGKINLYGIPPGSEPYLPDEEQDNHVFRANVAEAEVHEKLLGWLSAGKINLRDWISCILPWQEYQDGFDLVRSKKANKVVLTFR